MTRQAIEAMAEIDLNGDLTVEETILEEMIEIEVIHKNYPLVNRYCKIGPKLFPKVNSLIVY